MRINWKITVILLVALVLRLWNLDSIPPGLTPDEAALGYNAFSILKTGKDEYDNFLPIIFKSFGDYKPGLYVYLTAPFVAVFGLNEWSVRLPGAISGVIGVFLIYKIVSLLFKEEIRILNLKFSIGEITALLLAISPWHMYFSRGAWEINVALTLTLGGIYLFIKSISDSKFLIPSSILFALTLLTYQGAKLSTGIVVALLLVIYFKAVLNYKKKYLYYSIVGSIVIVLPIVTSFFTGQTGRLNVFSVFSYPRPEKYLQDFLNEGKERIGDINYYLYHTETLNFTRGILGRWFNHFSTRFLFFEGDWQNLRHSAPNSGVLILADSILLIIGLYSLFRREIKKETVFILLWLILAPLPAALSRDQVHAVRSFNMVIPLTIVTSLGLCMLLAKLSSVKLFTRTSSLVLLITCYVASYLYFLDAYFVHLPKHNSQYWYYGYKDAVKTVIGSANEYTKVKFQQSYDQPYIYFLFYGSQIDPKNYNPSDYQKNSQLNLSGPDVGLVERINNIYFTQINWPVDSREKGTLVVTRPEKVLMQDYSDNSKYKLVQEIEYLNGRDIAFRLIEVKK